MSSEAERKQALEEYKDYSEWGYKNWRAWGSWFSWGSPVGLALFFGITMVCFGIMMWLLGHAK